MSQENRAPESTDQAKSVEQSISDTVGQVVESSKTVASQVAFSAQATAAQAAMGAAATASTAAEGVKSVASEAAAGASATASQAGAGAQATAETAGDGVKASAETFVEEMTRLGAQVAATAKSALESPQVKEAQESMTNALSSFALSIEEQVKKLAERDDVKRVVQEVESTADTVIESIASNKAVQDVATGVMKGLATAASQLASWLGQQTPAEPQAGGGFGSESDAPATDDVQDIQVKKED